MPSEYESQYFADQARAVFEASLHVGEIDQDDMRKLIHLKEESLVAALESIEVERDLTEGEQELLVFLINLRRYHFSWHDPGAEGSLWSVLGEKVGPFVALVETSEKRRVGDFGITVLSKGDFGSKYPPRLKRIFESMSDDHMVVKYTDTEHSNEYGLSFAGAFLLRRPSEADEADIRGLKEVITSMLSIEDPLSLTREERFGQSKAESFFTADNRDLVEAFDRLEPHNMSAHQKDLFGFMFRLKRLHETWEEDRFPFQFFEDKRSKKLLKVGFDPIHKGESPTMLPITPEMIRDMLPKIEESEREHFLLLSEKMELMPPGAILVSYYDDVMTELHGFPYDALMMLETEGD